MLRANWVSLHQITFFIWAAATGLHLVGRLVAALRIAVLRRVRGVPGRIRRLALAVTALAAAVVLAVLLAHSAGDWGRHGAPFHPGGQSARPGPRS